MADKTSDPKTRQSSKRNAATPSVNHAHASVLVEQERGADGKFCYN